MLRSLLLFILCLVLSTFLVMPGKAEGSNHIEKAFEEVQKLEEKGQLNNAFIQLMSLKLQKDYNEHPEKDTYKIHWENLIRTIRLHQIATTYQTNKNFLLAQETLKDLLVLLDTANDAYDVHLVNHTLQKLIDFSGKANSHNDEKVNNLLKQASEKIKAGEYDEALLIFEQVEKYSDVEVSQNLLREAKLRKQQGEKLFNDKKVSSLLEQADFKVEAGEYDEALLIFEQVEKYSDAEVSQNLLREAKLRKQQGEEPAFYEPLLTGLKSGFLTILEWIIYIVAFLGIGWMVRKWKSRAPKPGLLIKVEDLTAEGHEHETASGRLSHELTKEIGRLGLPGLGTLQIEETEAGQSTINNTFASQETPQDSESDLDAPLVILDPAVPRPELARVDQLIKDVTPVNLGPFTVTPGHILAFVQYFRSIPYESYLIGTLSSLNDTYSLSVKRTDKEGKPTSEQTWETQGSGTDARPKVVRDMAIRISVDLGKSKITPNWRSLQAYLEGLDFLKKSETEADKTESFQGARMLFQDSIANDPNNYMARFHLALTLRKLKMNRASVSHLETLEQMLMKCNDISLATHINNQPEFPLLIQYNKATSLSGIRDVEKTREAVLILNKVINETSVDFKPGPDSFTIRQLNSQQKLRIEMLGLAARTSVRVLHLDTLRAQIDLGTVDPKDYQKTLTEFVSANEEDTNTLKDNHDKWRNIDLATYTASLSAAQSAMGRCYDLKGMYEKALDALRQAQANMPDSIDSYLTMASIYIKQKSQISQDWFSETKSLLDRALQLQPMHPKANHLMGKFYADPLVGESEEAIKYFEKATQVSPRPWTYFQHAEILAEMDETLKEAIKLLKLSILGWPKADYRFVRFVEYTLRLADQGNADAGLLNQALEAAKQLKTRGTKGGLKEKGGTFISTIEEKLAAQEKRSSKSPDQVTTQS